MVSDVFLLMGVEYFSGIYICESEGVLVIFGR